MELKDQSDSPKRPKAGVPRGMATGEMDSRRETMADGKRYIIYYTFREKDQAHPNKEGGEVQDV